MGVGTCHLLCDRVLDFVTGCAILHAHTLSLSLSLSLILSLSLQVV